MPNQHWIFLRGLTRGNVHWGDFPALFQKQNPEAKIELLEIPGNGTQWQSKTPTNPRKTIELIRKQSKFCQQNQSFHLCGISLGGMLALKWAEFYPQDVLSLAIVNTSLGKYSPPWKRFLPRNYRKILSVVFNANVAEQERLILEMTSNNFQQTKRHLDSFTEFSSKNPVSKLNFFRQLILANNIVLDEPLRIPLKVIFSKMDRLVDSSCSETISKQLAGETAFHPTAGHDLPLDEPQWLADLLINQ